MIVIQHNNKKITSVKVDKIEIGVVSKTFIDEIIYLSKKYPNKVIVWSLGDIYSNYLNEINNLDFQNENIIYHANPSNSTTIGKDLGYIDHNSMFLLNQNVKHFSWKISSLFGVTTTNLINRVEGVLLENKKESFSFILHSLGKQLNKKGLFCYYLPQFKINFEEQVFTNFNLYKFVKKNYKFSWLFILFINQFLNNKKFPVFELFYSFFYSKIKHSVAISNDFNSKIKKVDKDIDVLIPTIGREKYLYDFLIDLNNQTIIPQNVIIVEQNPDLKSKSNLEYIYKEKWKFTIIHKFIHQTGACNARNIGLKEVNSQWLFFADDDIRIESDFLEESLKKIEKLNCEGLAYNCLQENQSSNFTIDHQTEIFGSGSALVKSKFLNNLAFDFRYEFCFGEDFDFGMQLRNNGLDIVYVSNPSILHLKAPVGGFRVKPVLPWHKDSITPIPSPTIMLNNFKYFTQEQFVGIKFLYLSKLLFKKKSIKAYYVAIKQWKQSEYWANKLMNE